MISGNTQALKDFDIFVSNNYKKLYTHAYCTTKNNEDAHDLLTDTYVKIKQFIIASGYTSTQFITHFCKSITNAYIDQKRKKQYQWLSADILEDFEEENNYCDEEELQQKREHLCKKMFQYIEKKYDPRECYVFRVYYLYPPNQRMTYQKISQQTGLGITYCSDVIRKIRLDLKQTFNGLH